MTNYTKKRLFSNLDSSGTSTPVTASMADGDYTYLDNCNVLFTGAVLTAPRVVTLPAADALPEGTEIVLVDNIGGVTYTNYITINPNVGYTINNATNILFRTTNGTVKMITDGVSNWTAVVTIASGEANYVPTITGHSASGTLVAYYSYVGNSVDATIVMTGAWPSNATTFTITLPFTSKYAVTLPILAVDNGGSLSAVSSVVLTAGSNIATLNKVAGTPGGWLAAGATKRFQGTITYVKE